MRKQTNKPTFCICTLLLVCFLLGCASEPVKPAVEYFRLKDPKIDPELITSDGSTVTLGYEEIIPFEGKEIELAVQTKETVSEEDRQKYNTPTHRLVGRTVTQYYTRENVAIPSRYLWQKYKMSNGRIEFRITDDEKHSGMQVITINLTQSNSKDNSSIPVNTRISNSVLVKGIFQE